MSWLPPRTLGARTEWARTRPWLAGCYFGFFASVVFGGFVAIREPRFGLTLGLFIWPLSTVTFAILTKRGFGERADAEQHPLPTTRRMWSRASDRYLRGMMLVGALAGLASVIGLAKSSRSLFDGVALVAAVWIFMSARAERKLRDRL